MIDYRKCTDVEVEKVFTGFKTGFSDYIIKLEISQEDFIKRFFGPEANSLEHSHIALDGEEPVGVILGGIKDFDGVRTLRCGALCINPEYRGKGISQELFKLHKQTAVDNNCKQMFLEVIVGNDRAIKFYSKLGYDKIYDLSYFTHPEAAELSEEEAYSWEIKKLGREDFMAVSTSVADIHINWQNDFDYMSKLVGLSFYGAYIDSELVGALCMSPSGKVFFLWTMPQHRHKGVASSLIARAVKEQQLKRLSISFPNNSKLEGFVKHKGFVRDKLSQYEMYLTL